MLEYEQVMGGFVINPEVRLNEIYSEIDELELALKVCESHIQFIGNLKQAEKDKFMTKDYESQLGQDTYKRMSLQDKLRKLMRESMELQDKICMNID